MFNPENYSIPKQGKVNSNIRVLRRLLVSLMVPYLRANVLHASTLIKGNVYTSEGDIELIEWFQRHYNLHVDGEFGPKSMLKLNILLNEPESIEIRDMLNENTRTETITWAIRGNAVNPLMLSKSSERDRSNLSTKYGNPSRSGDDCVRIKPAINLVLAWNTRVNVQSVTVHKDAASAFARMFTEISEEFSKSEIETLGLNLYGGTFNYRNIRGGSTLSTHSWGIAIDINSLGNPMGANPSETVLGKNPELALRFFRIMYKNDFRTLRNDLMHYMYVG